MSIAALYVRVSTSKQEDNYSLATQLENCRTYAEREGYAVPEAHIYQDVASGFSLDRPALCELRAALRRGDIDVVIVNAYDRWASRNADLYRLYTDLQQGNAALVSVTQGVFQDTAIGRAIVNMYTTGRELWLEDHKERTMRGRKARATGGKLLPSGRPSYGYMWADDDHACLVPNPETAPIVQRIFAGVATTETLRSMAKRLDDEGVPTPTGGRHWSTATVGNLIGRSIYYGEARAFMWKHAVSKNGKPVMVRTSEDEQIIIPDAAPALVAKELAMQARARMKANKSHSKRNNRKPEGALLRAGYAVCGYCGLNLVAINASVDDRTVYRCNQVNRDRHGCPHFGIDAHILDVPVWTKVEEILMHPAIISAELTQLRANDPTEGDVKGLDRTMAENERKQRNLVDRLADEDDDEIAALMRVKLHELIKQKNELQQARAQITQRQEGWRVAQERLDDIEAWCRNVAANLGELTYEQKRLALEALGVKVQVWKEDHNPRWKMQTRINILSQSSC